jgi:hypothetical protein
MSRAHCSSAFPMMPIKAAITLSTENNFFLGSKTPTAVVVNPLEAWQRFILTVSIASVRYR